PVDEYCCSSGRRVDRKRLACLGNPAGPWFRANQVRAATDEVAPTDLGERWEAVFGSYDAVDHATTSSRPREPPIIPAARRSLRTYDVPTMPLSTAKRLP